MASPSFVAWNHAAEVDLAQLYDGPLAPGTRPFLESTNSTPLSQSDQDDLNEDVRLLISKVRVTQLHFGTSVVHNAAQGRVVEKGWLRLSAARQREIVEVVLEDVTGVSDYLTVRQHAPEIRIGLLLARGGRGLLELLEKCADPGGNKEEVRWLRNERYDRIVGTIEECQKKHWKTHKLECGKSLLSNHVPTLTDPTPKPQVPQSVALQAQLSLLAEYPTSLYVLVREKNLCNIYKDPVEEKNGPFLQLRKWAFDTKERWSIAECAAQHLSSGTLG
ncbi:hypothetical protein RQP46_008982 [Phenoliferia psychrophenolica]